MTGGTLIVNGPVSGGDAALDYDGSFTITGGVIIAAGSSGMAQAPGNDSTQNTLQVYYTSTQPAGTTVHLADNSGKALLTFTPTRNYQNIVISLPELVQGDTYQLYTGGSDSGETGHGLALYGDYSGGSLLAQLTLTDTTTRVSDSGEAVSGGMMMGGGMGGGGRGGRGEGGQPGGFDGEPPAMDGNGPGGEMPPGERPGGRGEGGPGGAAPNGE